MSLRHTQSSNNEKYEVKFDMKSKRIIVEYWANLKEVVLGWAQLERSA